MKYQAESIESIKSFVEAKGGILLSTEYKKFNIKLKFQCEKGHQWEALWASVKSMGTWCPACGGNIRKTPEEVLAICTKADLELITPIAEYKGAKRKLEFKCLAKGHNFFARLSDIKAGQRCAFCQGLVKPLINKLQHFATNKLGKLITAEYKNCGTKMLWQCEKGHQWEACWSSIQNGSWCPTCKLYKYEQLSRELLESITGNVFIKKKNFIPYSKYCGLELDGYSEKLQLAFEYNVEQHYKLSNWFHKTEKEFNEQIERDKFKITWCKKNGIYLIIIPFYKKTNLEQYIKQEVEKWQLSRNLYLPVI